MKSRFHLFLVALAIASLACSMVRVVLEEPTPTPDPSFEMKITLFEIVPTPPGVGRFPLP